MQHRAVAKRAFRLILQAVIAGACLTSSIMAGPSPRAATRPATQSSVAVSFAADDGVMVHGLYRAPPYPKALILLFHQAGSSKGEYATIAPRLATAGYASLAIDQRSGGSLFGRNETAAGLKRASTMTEAKRDMLAALHWAQDKNLPIILWGSSYSASLVFVVAAQHPDKLAAVLAFSPGEYFGRGLSISTAAASVDVPVFVTSADDPGEVAAARAILSAAPARTKVQFVPVHGGLHGSSTLISGKNPAGAGAAWQAVLSFLSGLTS